MPADESPSHEKGQPGIGRAALSGLCPRCGEPMQKINDAKQSHIEYEACAEHGLFMDAGEFTDYKHETLLDYFRALIASVKRRV